VTFYNPTNGFSVVRLRLRGRREPIAVVGTLPAAQPGEILSLRGRWQTDPRHGAQFRPTTAEVRRPSDVDGIVRYLGSGLIRQIGPVLAKRIVGTFGVQTLDVLDATPERVREVPGIGPQRARTIAAAWSEHRALRDVMAFLAEHGLDTRFAPRLLATYGTDASRILAANPYRLVADVPGLGFASADRLGQDLGIRPTAPARIQAAVQAALLRASENGHTRLGRPALAEAAADAAEVAPDLVESGVEQLLAGGTIAMRSPPPSRQVTGNREQGTEAGGLDQAPLPPPAPEHRAGRVRIYTPAAPTPPPPSTEMPSEDDGLGIGLAGLVRAEEDLASRLLALARRSGVPAARATAWLADDAESRSLSEEQRTAVVTAVTSGCFVLTGGPGVGKTTTTRAIVRCLEVLGRSVALAAPTGKAARRLGEVVGLEARTLHRLLGAGPRGFRHGPREPLPYDVVIVDEASMLDTQLARSVVRAIGVTSQLILVGDADQLPSVGPGQVLRDILASDRLPSARLETVFRQAARSQIVTNAHRIRQGLLPELAPPQALAQAFGLLPEQALGPRGGRNPDADRAARGSAGPTGSDCVFVAAPPSRVAAVAAEWAAVRLPRLLGIAPGDVQAIAPLVRVCQTLNSLLQERLNPGRGQPERPHGALPLRVGDRVIQTHNNYHLGVFNGDTGTIVEIEGAARLTVDFGDGRVVAYGAADVLDLDHAYGLTVHRAQGSEWPGVVVLASSSFGPILSRNLLYTALTRARRAVVVVGDQAAIAEAVARTRDQERVTGLPALLKESGARLQVTGYRLQEGGAAAVLPSAVAPRDDGPLPPAPSPAKRGKGSGGVTLPPPVPAEPVWDPEDADVVDDLAELSVPPMRDEPFEPMPDDWPDDDAW
jgi:exodeoxyribonuclease V alpha subunit